MRSLRPRRVHAAVAFAWLATGCAPAERLPDVVLLSIDTLRADHVGAYGYARDTSPRIDRLAAEGILFENAIAETSWTLPAHASLFTGLSSGVHGVTRDDRALAGSLPTLATLLRDAGYETVGLWSGPYLHPIFGLGRGFERYEGFAGETAWDDPAFLALRDPRAREAALGRRDVAAQEAVTSPALVARALEVLGEERERPLFLFVHLFDVHTDYVPPESDWRRFDPDYQGTLTGVDPTRNPAIHAEMPPAERAHLTALYDGEIRFTDRHVGGLLDGIDALGRREHTLVLLTSDHGEEFFEHGGVGHRRTLFDEMLRVPLVARLPDGGGAGRRVSAQVAHIDLLPTLLDWLGLEASASMGRSFAPALRDGGALPEAAVASRLEVPGRGTWLAIRDPGWKLVVAEAESRPAGPAMFLDLTRDPRELSPGAGEGSARVAAEDALAAWRARETRWRARRPDASAAPIDLPDALRERLQALGYTDDTPADPQP